MVTMASWTVGSLLFLAAAACAASAPDRIVGGNPTTIENYPSIVQVESRTLLIWGQSCAANILTTRYVLSAAHCFAGLLYSASNRRIRAGTTNRNSGGIVINIVREYNHPTYGIFGDDGDISVVLLTSPLNYGPTIQQGGIVPQGLEILDHIPVTHAGWGATSQGGPASSVLLDVTVFTINRALCTQWYANQLIPARVTENMICVGILDVGGRNACQGDSGGPLYLKVQRAAEDVVDNVLVGVVSWGRGCADSHFPGVNTRVASYTNWIVQTAV